MYFIFLYKHPFSNRNMNWHILKQFYSYKISLKPLNKSPRQFQTYSLMISLDET